MRLITPLVILILSVSGSYAQIGYRTTTHDVAVTNSYDGTYDFDKIDCKTEMTSLVGQELYFPIRNGTAPFNPQDKSYVEDKWFDDITSDEAVPFESLLNDDLATKLKDPIRGAGWRIRDVTLHVGNTGYSANKGYATHVYRPKITEYPRSINIDVRTPYSALENRTFKIIACSDSIIPGTYNGSCYFSFTLQDEDMQILYISLHSANVKEYPFYFKRHLEQQKKAHVGKKYYARCDIPTAITFRNPLNDKMYNNEPEKEYTCTEFTFVRTRFGDVTKPYLILKDSTGQEIAVCPEGQEKSVNDMGEITNFWDEAEYTRFKIQRKRTYDSLVIAWQQAEEELIREIEELKKEKDKQKIKLKKAQTDRLNGFIAKYGQKAGMMVAIGKVALGMTLEMCKDAWGEPASTTKSSEGGKLTETWRYSTYHWLRFTNGKLTTITQ